MAEEHPLRSLRWEWDFDVWCAMLRIDPEYVLDLESGRTTRSGKYLSALQELGIDVTEVKDRIAQWLRDYRRDLRRDIEVQLGIAEEEEEE